MWGNHEPIYRSLILSYHEPRHLARTPPPVSLQMSVAAGVDALGGELHLDSWVTAHLVDGSSHRGVLHTVDPETGTVILLKPEGVSACEPNRDACMQLC